jgi:galacturonosyltransferase
MSNVLLEAAACGRPIIASNISGCIETFDEGLTGLSFQNKSTLDLIDKIENFINFTHENKMKMGLRGREKVEKEFNRKTIVNVYLKEIRKIMTEVDNLPDKKSN